MEFLIEILLNAVILVVVLAVISFLIIHHKKRRTNRIAEIAIDLKLAFSCRENPDCKDSIFESMSFGIFKDGSVEDMIYGEVGNAEFAIFDHGYAASYGAGQYNSAHHQTVIYFKSANLQLPRFTLSPDDLYHKTSSAYDFPTHLDFSGKYLLRGKDAVEIRALFTDKLLDFFCSLQEINVEGGGDQLIVYRDNKRLRPEKWKSFMDEGVQIFGEFLGAD